MGACCLGFAGGVLLQRAAAVCCDLLWVQLLHPCPAPAPADGVDVTGPGSSVLSTVPTTLGYRKGKLVLKAAAAAMAAGKTTQADVEPMEIKLPSPDTVRQGGGEVARRGDRVQISGFSRDRARQG